jgi:hypothetical protein
MLPAHLPAHLLPARRHHPAPPRLTAQNAAALVACFEDVSLRLPSIGTLASAAEAARAFIELEARLAAPPVLPSHQLPDLQYTLVDVLRWAAAASSSRPPSSGAGAGAGWGCQQARHWVAAAVARQAGRRDAAPAAAGDARRCGTVRPAGTWQGVRQQRSGRAAPSALTSSCASARSWRCQSGPSRGAPLRPGSPGGHQAQAQRLRPLRRRPPRYRRQQLVQLRQEGGLLLWVDLKELAANCHCLVLCHEPGSYAHCHTVGVRRGRGCWPGRRPRQQRIALDAAAAPGVRRMQPASSSSTRCARRAPFVSTGSACPQRCGARHHPGASSSCFCRPGQEAGPRRPPAAPPAAHQVPRAHQPAVQRGRRPAAPAAAAGRPPRPQGKPPHQHSHLLLHAHPPRLPPRRLRPSCCLRTDPSLSRRHWQWAQLSPPTSTSVAHTALPLPLAPAGGAGGGPGRRGQELTHRPAAEGLSRAAGPRAANDHPPPREEAARGGGSCRQLPSRGRLHLGAAVLLPSGQWRQQGCGRG